ncbi:MAG TPA: hypothetical protein VMA35_13035 [Candidatus Sulfopaludibacter sp.]|nr:hypothetical protein [Candidatus Sulfopaludibacter sp.]
MNVSLLEHIEAKIINFLHDVKTPHHASRIAVHIREKREDTLQAIQKLVENRIIKGVQDFALFGSTGETMAYELVNVAPEPTPVMPPIPPSPLPPQTRHRPAPGA